MTRHDVKKLDAYQARKGELRLIEVPASRFLAIDGAGDPNTEVFARAVEALYPFAYTPVPARDALSQASGPTATSRTTTLPRTARTPHTRPVKPPATSEDK